MIQVNGHIIMTVDDFEKHFDLNRMVEIASQIVEDTDIFVGLEEYDVTLEALARVMCGAAIDVEEQQGQIHWMIDDLSGSLEGSVGGKKTKLDGVKAKKLLISALGHKSYSPIVTLGTEPNPTPFPKDPESRIPAPESQIPNPPKTPKTEGPEDREDPESQIPNPKSQIPNPEAQRPYTALHSEQSVVLDLAKEDAPGILRTHTLVNNSLQGSAYVEAGPLKIEIKANHAVTLLLKDRGLTAVLHHESVGPFHRIESQILDDGSTQILNTDLETGKVTKPASFPQGALWQVCADNQGGFVALVDGQVLTYSRLITPDALEDMMIPEDEKIVMIAISGAQIMLLTSQGRTYSNFRNPWRKTKNVLRVGVDANGAIYASAQPLKPEEL